jgi:tape measure domain-containing protein
MSSNALIYDLILETKQATLATQKMVADSKSQADKAGKDSGNAYGMSFSKAVGAILTSNAIIGLFSGLTNTVKNFSSNVFDSAIKTEQQAKAFEKLTGSAEASAKVMGDINKLAVKSPYSVEELREIAKRLVALGVAQDQVVGKTKMLGDISSATGGDLFLLSKAYTDVQARGKLLAQEINQFANQGVGIRDILAKNLGVTVDEVIRLGEEGQISFKMFDDALNQIYRKNYLGYMEVMAETAGGRIQNLGESFNLLGQEIIGVDTATGKIKPDSVFDNLTKALYNTLKLIGDNKEGIKQFADSITKFISENQQIILLTGGVALAIGLITGAVTLLASPIVLATAGIVAISAGIAVLGTELAKNEGFVKSAKTAWEAIQKSFTEAVTYITEQLKPVFEDISKNVMPVLEKTFKSFLDLLPLLLEYLKPVAKFFTDVFVIAIETVITVFKGLVKFIGGFFDLLIGLFTGNGDKIKEGFLNMFGGIGDAVGGIFKGIFNVIIKIINDGISNINKLIQQIPDNIFSTFGKNKNDFKIPEIPKFAGGADFMGGGAGIDKNLVSFWANRDERIIVQTPAQQNDNSSYSNTTNYNNYGSTPMFLSSAF